MEIMPVIKEDENSVWNDYVSITKRGVEYDVYLTSHINVPEYYNELVDVLLNAEEYEMVNLHINNGGGCVDSAFMIIDAIEKSAAFVTAKLSGTVASAATVITMACHRVECSKYLSFMVHNYSTGMQGKGHELKAYQTFTDRELNRAFKEIYKGFLTDEEMDKVIEGTDIWLNEQEVLERWDNRKVL